MESIDLLNFPGQSMSSQRILFLLKLRDLYGPDTYSTYGSAYSSGLFNSALFVSQMLTSAGVDSKVVEVTDNNSIDREVHDYKPTSVILEALWVIPDKFDILVKLHPNVKWVVRCHSKIPFLANEAIAVGWLIHYLQHDNVFISGNSEESIEDIRSIISLANRDWSKEKVHKKVIYLPNYYPIEHAHIPSPKVPDDFLDVGCFGAIRPMKNQLIQALAAIEVAAELKKPLRFHVNGTRLEQQGASVLKNLESLLPATGNQLVSHTWLSHADFMQLLTTMDIGMQVSFSETFNIVSADMVTAGVSIVVSHEISWASGWSKTDPNESEDIKETLLRVIGKFSRLIRDLNIHGLKEYSHKSRHIWLEEVEDKRL